MPEIMASARTCNNTASLPIIKNSGFSTYCNYKVFLLASGWRINQSMPGSSGRWCSNRRNGGSGWGTRNWGVSDDRGRCW